MRTLSTTLLCCAAMVCVATVQPRGNQTPPQTAQGSIGFDPEAKLKELGIVLPVPGKPVANYVDEVRTGNLLFLAGRGSTGPDGKDIVGKLGRDLTVQQGYQAARVVAISQLGVLKTELGDLKRVKRIVKVLGMVNSDPAFGQQPEVINGFSDLMVAVFGERGRHARSSVGMGALPRGLAVEIEAIVEIEP